MFAQNAVRGGRRSFAAATPSLFELAMALIVILGLGFAFVGLAASSYGIDELFTLHVIDHQGGLAEVTRRTLSHTGPPLYYGLLFEWSKLAGLSEVALRLPSAVFATGAVMLFALGAGAPFSRPARLSAAAVAVCGRFWFIQSQLALGYALALLVSAGLVVLAMALRRRVLEGRSPWSIWTGLTLLSLTGAMVHFYLALEAGLVVGFLVLTTGPLRLRLALLGSGLVCVAVTATYGAALLSHTQEDIEHMGFGVGSGFLVRQALLALRDVYGPLSAAAMIVVMVGALVRARKGLREGAPVRTLIAPDLTWAAGLAAFVLAGMAALGVAASLAVAPSFSGRSLLVAAPMVWLLTAVAFELGGFRRQGPPQPALVLGMVLLLGASQTQQIQGRFLPRGEEWRASARYVDETKACRGRAIPVLAPPRYGPPTPYFMRLAQQAFYGRYAASPQRLVPFAISDVAASARPDLAALWKERLSSDAARCPILAAQVHGLSPGQAEGLRRAIASAIGAPQDRVVMRSFPHFRLKLLGWRAQPGAYIYLARRAGPG